MSKAPQDHFLQEHLRLVGEEDVRKMESFVKKFQDLSSDDET